MIMREHSDVGKIGRAGSPVVMMREKSTIRLLNTILLLIASLRQFLEIALDRLDSHPCENYFGYLRRVVHTMNSYDQMLKTVTKGKLVKKGLVHINNDSHIFTHLNTGGVKLSGNRHIRMGQPELNLLIASDPYPCTKTCTTVICRGESSQEAQCHFPYIKQLAKFARRSNIAKETDHFFSRTANQRIVTLIFDHLQGGKSILSEMDGINSQTMESQ
jgi:hypothetical protein